MDRISGLPKIILHDILSRLPEKDAVRTSILSKGWRETCYTYRVFSISDSQITTWRYCQTEEDLSRRRKMLLDYVKKRLLRFYDQGLAVKELKLEVSRSNLQYMSQDMDVCVKLASESSVEVLELNVQSGGSEKNNGPEDYILKRGVPETKSLNKLVLNGCIILDQAFLDKSIKFFSLRELSLCSVLVGDQEAFEHFISQCPLIEHITLKCCFVYYHRSTGDQPVSRTRMRSISLHGLQKLKEVYVKEVEKVYIDAPNLEEIGCRPDAYDFFKLNFDNCRNLRKLYIWNSGWSDIGDHWLSKLFSKFPLLESLKFGCCHAFKRINISSAQLNYF